MSDVLISYNSFSETIKDYPFYVGYNCGLVIDQRLKEDSQGNIEYGDLYVVTSGLPYKSPQEVAEFLRNMADLLDDELEDDSVEQL